MKTYKCKGCQTESNLLTLGELTMGCLNCHSRAGFMEREGKGEWKDRHITQGEQKLNIFLRA